MFGIGSSKSDRSFYEAFERHAAQIVEAGKLLSQLVRQPERAAELAKAIHDIENAGDIITHETIARLHKTWITPIDRADIHSLISALDDHRFRKKPSRTRAHGCREPKCAEPPNGRFLMTS